MSRRSSSGKLLIISFVLLILIIILGELLWVLDPLRVGDLFLIDYIPHLIAAAAIVPVLWAAAAWRAIVAERKPGGGMLFILRLVIIVASFSAAGFILIAPRMYIGLGLSLGIALISIAGERIIREYHFSRALPKRSLLGSGSIILVLAFLLCPTGYLVTYPGITMEMNRYAAIEQGESRSSIAGVLIFERPAFPVDWLYARLFPHYEFAKQEDLGMSLGEYNQVVRVMKQDADTVAAAVALDRLGIGRGVTYHGVILAAVMNDSPVIGTLNAGDIIIQIEDQPIRRTEELIEAISRVKPGEELTMIVQREGKSLKLLVPTGAHPENPERAILGVQIVDHVQYDVPLQVDYRSYMLHEGGPSHGAMLTLALIDQLTPGGITGGLQIAGTGTIRLDGSIGKIGGIRQKAFTVERSGADVFFVPQGQEEEARRGANQLRIVPVSSIDEILDWLKEHAPQGAS